MMNQTQQLQPLPTGTPQKHILCYVVYGDDPMYYQGVKISLLSFFSHIPPQNRPLVVILSQDPTYFTTWSMSSSHILSLTLSESMIKAWTTDNYYYRIKTMGLAYIVQTLVYHQWANEQSKFLFFDSDTYFTKNPLALYDNITTTQVVMYKKEPKIHAHKKYRNYVEGLANKTLTYYDNQNNQQSYQLSKDASMYSSLIMGIMPNMLPQLYQAAGLMYPMRQMTNARTVEQFAFVEIMKQYYHIYQGKDFVHHYSRRRQKQFVQSQLTNFWQQYPDNNIDVQITAISNIKFTRPWYLILAQALKRLIKPEHIY